MSKDVYKNLNIAMSNFIFKSNDDQRKVFDYVTCNLGVDEDTQDFDALVDQAICDLGLGE